jgi:hypothetical protein
MALPTPRSDASVPLRILGAAVLLLLAAALVYTTAIAVSNFSRIGV